MHVGTGIVPMIQETLVLVLVHPALNGVDLETPRAQISMSIL